MPDYSWYDTSQVIDPGAEAAGIGSSIPEWLTSVGNLSSFSPETFSKLGFSGDMFSREGSGLDSYQVVSPEFSNWMSQQGYKISPTWESSTLSDQNGKQLGTAYPNWDDPLFGMLVNSGVAAVTGGALGGGGFAGGLGVSNPALAGAINSGLAGGMVAGGSDGNILQGILQGAIGGGLGGAVSQLNPAGSLGIENKTLASMFNKGVGNTIGTLASTQDPKAAFTSGLTGAATTGLNAMGGNFFKSLFGGTQEGDSNFMGPPSWAGGSSFMGPPDLMMGPPSDLAPGFMGPPADLFNNVMQPNMSEAASFPDKQVSSAPSMSTSGLGGRLGNFALNNAGDLASLIYGLYNNRKQQKALGNQISGLEGLFAQNSPYAQQLRAKLGAQAAAKGSRLNTSGRETQLQAMLADRAASMAPSLYQMQQGQNQLQNNNMNMLLQGFNKMGGFKTLQDLFKG